MAVAASARGVIRDFIDVGFGMHRRGQLTLSPHRQGFRMNIKSLTRRQEAASNALVDQMSPTVPIMKVPIVDVPVIHDDVARRHIKIDDGKGHPVFEAGDSSGQEYRVIRHRGQGTGTISRPK